MKEKLKDKKLQVWLDSLEFNFLQNYSKTNHFTVSELIRGWIHEVMKKTGGKWPGIKEFIRIFASIRLDTVRGPVYLDEQRNPVQKIYIRQVERKRNFGYTDLELWNTVVKTYPKVSQYGHFPKQEFLKQPVYSREFPPCRYCK